MPGIFFMIRDQHMIKASTASCGIKNGQHFCTRKKSEFVVCTKRQSRRNRGAILSDMLTLFSSGGQIIPTILLIPPSPGFLDISRP